MSWGHLPWPWTSTVTACPAAPGDGDSRTRAIRAGLAEGPASAPPRRGEFTKRARLGLQHLSGLPGARRIRLHHDDVASRPRVGMMRVLRKPRVDLLCRAVSIVHLVRTTTCPTNRDGNRFLNPSRRRIEFDGGDRGGRRRRWWL